MFVTINQITSAGSAHSAADGRLMRKEQPMSDSQGRPDRGAENDSSLFFYLFVGSLIAILVIGAIYALFF